MKYFVVLLVLLLPILSFAQPGTTPAKDSIHLSAEVMPEFPDGDAGLMRYIATNMSYPSIDGYVDYGGTIYVKFIVTEMGGVDSVKVVKGIEPHIDAEAMRVICSMPQWKPGTLVGKPVKVQYMIPIRIHTN